MQYHRRCKGIEQQKMPLVYYKCNKELPHDERTNSDLINITYQRFNNSIFIVLLLLLDNNFLWLK